MKKLKVTIDEGFFLENQELIDEVLGFVLRKNYLSHEEAEDFKSEAKLKFIRDDYAVLKKFKRESSLKTFLVVVCGRFYLDYCDKIWGRWRPSVQAKRLGTPALLLEKCMVREGYSLREATEILCFNYGLQVTESEIHELYNKLPTREGRHFHSEEVLEKRPAEALIPDEALIQSQKETALGQVYDQIWEKVALLDPEDRQIIRLHFQKGISLAQVAKTLGLDSKGIYRRVSQVLDRLRQHLEGHPFGKEDIRRLLK